MMTYHDTNEFRIVLGIDGSEIRQKIIDTDNASELAPNFAFPSRLVRFKPTTPVNLFVDMDGTLVHFRQNGEKYVDINGDTRYFHLDDIYEPGYYHPNCLPPEINVLRAVQSLTNGISPYTVYVLSAVEPRSASAYIDKNLWLDQYLPEVKAEHRIFMPCGAKKADYINLANGELNVLLDDYTRNLQEWTTGKVNNIGIKILNGINDTHKSWQGDRVPGNVDSLTLAKMLVHIANREIESRGIILR
jgi:5'(3')-deoxyribonucleotidase